MDRLEILTFLEDNVAKIEVDRKRLCVILNSINSGESPTGINERLIENISKLDFKDGELSTMAEYVTLVLSNIVSTSITTTKAETEELIKILTHLLEVLKPINLYIEKVEEARTPSDVLNEVVRNKSKWSDKLVSYVSNYCPNNKVSNVMAWSLIIGVIIFILFKYDHTDLINATKYIVHLKKDLK